MTITVFFPAPGVAKYQATRYLYERGFLMLRAYHGHLVYVPRPGEEIRTHQKHYLIREITCSQRPARL